MPREDLHGVGGGNAPLTHYILRHKIHESRFKVVWRRHDHLDFRVLESMGASFFDFSFLTISSSMLVLCAVREEKAWNISQESSTRGNDRQVSETLTLVLQSSGDEFADHHRKY